MALEWLSSLWRRAPIRANDPGYDDRYWPAEGVSTASGLRVNSDRPTVSAVYRCGALLSQAVAGLPGGVYRRLARGREEIPEHDVNRIFWKRPNPYQNAVQFKAMMMWHAIFRGAAFARVVQGPEGVELWPLHPDRFGNPELLESGRVRYTYTAPNGTQTKVIKGLDLFVFDGLSADGLRGLALLDLAKDTFGLARATEQYGATLFARGARFSGGLKLPAGRTIANPKAKKELSDSIRMQGAGEGAWHGVPIFEDGMEWQSISMTNDDAQFLETRKFTVSDIARWFGIPPHMIGDVERSTSWGTGIEAQSTQFVQYGLLPWVTLMEATIGGMFVSEPDAYVKFKLNALLRGDTPARFAVYAIGIDKGIFSPNDCRELEDLNPREGGDVYVTPTAPQQAKGSGDGAQAPDAMPAEPMPMDEPAEPDAVGPTTQLTAAMMEQDKRKRALADLRVSAASLGIPEKSVRRLIADAKAKE